MEETKPVIDAQEMLQNIDVASYTETAINYGVQAVAALVIFILGKWIARRLANLLERMMTKGNVDDTLVQFLGNIAYGLMLAFVVIATLSQVGIETASLAAVIAAAGLAIGLAMQGSLSNFAAGVMLILFRPFKAGDYVEAGGVAGTVEEVNIFTTEFKTPDNKKVIVPNSAVSSGAITNYSTNDTRRVDMVIGVGYDDDLSKVKDILNKVVSADERVLKSPEPVIAVSELADSSVNLVVRPWVKTEDYWGVYFDTIETVKNTFDKEGISIPYPQQDLHVKTGVIEKIASAAE